MRELLDKIKKLGWERIGSMVISLFVVGIMFIDTQFTDGVVLKILWFVVGLIFLLSVSLVFVTAGFSVMRTLIKVSVGLTLMVFIGQSYCDSSLTTAYSNEALKSLMGIGILYVIYEFLHTLFKTLAQYKNKIDTNNNDSKGSKWFVIILFLAFVTYFTWTIYEVIKPIILDLCIYG